MRLIRGNAIANVEFQEFAKERVQILKRSHLALLTIYTTISSMQFPSFNRIFARALTAAAEPKSIASQLKLLKFSD